jgi:hypothetical protein
MRAGWISGDQCLEISGQFAKHIDEGVWRLAPVSTDLLKRTKSILLSAPGIFLRAGDAIHLLTAQQMEETEVWTGDRHMLAAAPHFGLTGRSV